MKKLTIFDFRFSILLCVLCAGLFLASCSIVMPRAAEQIDGQANNAKRFNQKVADDPNVPTYVKKWVQGEADTWGTFSKWGHGQSPDPIPASTTQPAQ